MIEDPIKDGPNKGHLLSKADIDNLLNWYYSARGWNQKGIPTQQTLLSVGLMKVAEDMQKLGIG